MQQKHGVLLFLHSPQFNVTANNSTDIELCYVISSGELSLVLLASNADTKE